ncbi:MAG: hypothetical protein QG650_166 [Patescibacteria group bacterium]|nr:hypothetical protein [Patescibacteria group bacterium]
MAGKTAVTVADTGIPYVESEMEETDIGKIRREQEARVVFDSLPEKTFTGAVTFVSPTSSTDANGVVTYRVRVTFGFSPFPVPEGSVASVDYVVKEAKNVLVVPQSAIRRSENGNPTVFSIGRNAEISIKTGVSDGKMTEVLEGLRQGERIRY